MKIIERRHAILDTLQKEGSCDLNDLARRFNVSSMTVRRDLKELAGNGSITVSRGLAVMNDGALQEYSMLVKHDIAVEEKKRIARACLGYIQDGDSIFLDAGTTAKELAALLARNNRSVNIMTHSLLAAQELSASHQASMIMCPGEYRAMSMAFMGPLTDDFIKKFQIDTLFLTIEGVDLAEGVSVVDVADGHSKEVLIDQAKQVVLLADSTKFGKSFFYKVAQLDKIDAIITDSGLDSTLREAFVAAGVKVICA